MGETGRLGFGGERPQTGFAQHMGSPKRQTTIMEKPSNDGFTEAPKRFVSKHPGTARLDWPPVALGRAVNKTKAGNGWKNFTKTFGMAVGAAGGQVTEFGKLACVYIEPHEFTTMLSERYSTAARDMDPGRSKRIVREMVDSTSKGSTKVSAF